MYQQCGLTNHQDTLHPKLTFSLGSLLTTFSFPETVFNFFVAVKNKIAHIDSHHRGGRRSLGPPTHPLERTTRMNHINLRSFMMCPSLRVPGPRRPWAGSSWMTRTTGTSETRSSSGRVPHTLCSPSTSGTAPSSPPARSGRAGETHTLSFVQRLAAPFLCPRLYRR